VYGDVASGRVEDDLNLYAYVGNDPLDKTDPSGKCLEDLCIGEAALGYEAVVWIGGALGIGAAAEHVYNQSQGPPVPKPSSDNSTGPKAPGSESGSTLKPGAHAGDSIPARGPDRDFTRDERDRINEIGGETGCHTCGSKDPGTKSGDFVPDHQPPSATNTDQKPQSLFPQCLGCSRKQGGEVRQKQQQTPQPVKSCEAPTGTRIPQC